MAEQCRAKAKSTGQKCTRPVVPGTTVCRFHGGAASQVVAKGAARIAEAKARDTFGRLETVSVPVEDPFAAFAEIAGHAVAWERFCAGKIEELAELRFEDQKGAEQIRGDVVLFERAMDRCRDFLRDYAKLGIEDRLAKIETSQRATVIRAVEAVLTHLGVGGDQRPVIDSILARELSR